MASSFDRYSSHYLAHSIDTVFQVESTLPVGIVSGVVLVVFHNYLDMVSLVVVGIQRSLVAVEVMVEAVTVAAVTVVGGTLPQGAVEMVDVDMGSRTRCTLCTGPSLLPQLKWLLGW
ncbi:unnamed protein product [Sphenostylis stenocarpa]|uniref:Uncharacterized protein n=1 Tax=Sphenostylis stenocarpa TaxID=92480 RepID=A0AA86RQC9_9FABA|nr:unnamed protein product [Sphenostylis stenocarpa]